MKRRMRQALAVMLGLWLGWGAAAWATDESHKAGSGDHAAAAAGHAEHKDDAHAGDAHADLGQTTAAQLVPAGSQITWVKPLALGIAGLFVAAVAIGIPALRLRGPLPPDPADTHDDHAHGHDDHGHDKGHGHDHGHGKSDHGHKH
jgi:hypothetical protein